ncbi:hypothetical protein NQ318_021117 [Aromia moschata]|uniref:Rho-GAP domain-containing protein n=1 Tax=Aromia moschata TaxID=1265417 RepID=A0AAV8YGG0_9CUCU|nr:hypothetical protein NQ318_021117 [Aromia moschata]
MSLTAYFLTDIRLQLNEQLRCLDVRMEAQVALLTELQDFFRRRGELELDYSKNLDKLAKSLQLRHKEQKAKHETIFFRREQWPLFSSYACWQQLVTQTKNLSRDHVALSEVYSTHLVSRLSQVMEDVQRIYKRRKNKYTDAKLKALKARNEYILCLEASNTTIHKYFVDDLSDLIDCMDFGFHNCISRALLMHVTAEEGRQKSVQNGLDTLSACINSLDSRLDKQRFLEYNHSAFMIPKKLEFQGQKTDEQPEPEIQNLLHREMESRLTQLQQRVTSLRAESEEVWKTLETAEELRADRQETEEFYLTKFREYLLGSSRIARLDAKQEFYGNHYYLKLRFCNSIKRSQKRQSVKRIGRLQMSGQPKLFGGSIEEYQEATNQEIPLIMKSCIRVINLYGLHHQGIFRVSGSQVEINNFREWFESLPRPVMIVLRYLFAFLNHLSEFSDENMMDPYNLAICFGPTLVPVPDDKDQVQYQNQVNELIKNIIIFNDEIFPNDGGNPTKESVVISHLSTTDTDKSKTQNIVIDPPSLLNTSCLNCPNDKAGSVEIQNPKLDETELTSKQDQAEIDESNVNFSQNRELWQRRANLESMPASPLLKSHRFSEPYMQRQNHTPDLVMDLPLVGNSSPKELLTKSLSVLGNMYPDSASEEEVSPTKTPEASAGADSPDMQTAAETFAKQNQCTLKKNKKMNVENTEFVAITSPMLNRKYATIGSNSSTTTTFKPQPKAKPLVLKKPVFSVPLRSVSIEMMCKRSSRSPNINLLIDSFSHYLTAYFNTFTI